MAHETVKKRKAQRTPGYYLSSILKYLILLLIAAIAVMPFFLATMGTFKTNAEIIAFPPKVFPEKWLWENWSKVWNTDIGSGGTFPRWLFNTAFLSVTVASLQVICCSMAAYAFARLDFPGKNATFNFMLATMMIPGAVTLIPAYVLMSKLHLINTYWALIIPGAVGASGIFMLTQFFKSIPVDLEEAAVIDGASHMKVFSSVILPLARPSLLTVFILQFQGMWNAFLQPLLYENSPDMYVLNVALSIFKQQYKAQWNLTLVGAMFNAIPVLILFFIFSRYYIEGVAYTGVKG
ncbi:MAG TPA: carbohydrate ABC transporter permease [Anaerolineaceae bacterium]|jgi:multiple sugar transport system permease protein|nr:carbohydrate ABC transporter permease [Anaerolineaceae bacterium]